MTYRNFALVFLLFISNLIPAYAAKAAVVLKDVFPDQKFTMPLAMIQHPSDDKRWYVVEQNGRVLEMNNGKQKLFADLTDRVQAGGEKGLLGFAFHPDYEKNGELFFSYTIKFNGDIYSVVSRWKSKNGVPDGKSEQVLLKLKQPYGNHNGGQITFGPDGYLYIGLGDGGWAGDPGDNAQNIETLLGSLLRIDVNQGTPYAIPKDNPFVQKKGRDEIYAYGLRNPWRWSFDLKTGDLWLADVGQDDYEEINLIRKGGNYGWNEREGKHCYGWFGCDSDPYIDPVHEYDHDQGQSITGGYVYHGKAMPEMAGKYLFGDFVSGRIWALETASSYRVTELMKSDHNISSFGQGRDGEVYVVSYSQGKVYQLLPSQ